MTNTFKQLPRYTLQQLPGCWQIAIDGKPHSIGSKETALEWLEKWANNQFTTLTPRKRDTNVASDFWATGRDCPIL